MTHRSKQRIAIAFVALVAAAAASCLLLAAVRVDDYVFASGTVTTSRRQTVAAPGRGTLARLLAENGSRVKEGQPLLELRNDALAELIRQREADVRLAQAELERQEAAAKGTRARHEAQFALARLQVERARKEHDRAAEAAAKDQARAPDLERAKLDLDIAQKRLDAEAAADPQAMEKETAVLKEKAQAAAARLDEARGAAERLLVKAPISGILSLRDLSAGETVEPGSILGEVFDDSAFVVKLRVGERDLQRIERDRPVRVWLAAHAWEPRGNFAGRILSVAPAVTPEDGGEGTVAIEVLLDNNDKPLKPGMQARAGLRAGQASLLSILLRASKRCETEPLEAAAPSR